MKKKLLLVVAGIGLVVGVNGQTNTFPASGNVGIGTINPIFNLDVNGTSHISGNVSIGHTYNGQALNVGGNVYVIGGSIWVNDGNAFTSASLPFTGMYPNSTTGIGFKTNGSEKMRIDINGNVGIGTTSPSGKIHSNVIGVFDVTPLIRLGSDDNTGRWDVVNAGNPTVRRVLQGFYQTTKTIQFDPAGDIWFNTGGNVGIGTTSPQNKLDVNGTIHAKEVKVDLIGWSDFVFAPAYKLKTLAEVEQYIKTHNHLPEIPSAKEVEQNGVSLGDMQAKLLQKVEELTLYSIEQEKANAELEQKLAKQEKEIKELKVLIMKKMK